MTFDDYYILYDDVDYDDLHYTMALIYSTIDYCNVQQSDLIVTPEDISFQIWAASTIHGEPFIRNISAFKKKNRLRTETKDKWIELFDAMKLTERASERVAEEFVNLNGDSGLKLGELIKRKLESNSLFLI